MHRNGGGTESPASYVKVLSGGSPIGGLGEVIVCGAALVPQYGRPPDFPENREFKSEFSIFRLVRQGRPGRGRARLRPGPVRVRTSSGPANAASLLNALPEFCRGRPPDRGGAVRTAAVQAGRPRSVRGRCGGAERLGEGRRRVLLLPPRLRGGPGWSLFHGKTSRRAPPPCPPP